MLTVATVSHRLLRHVPRRSLYIIQRKWITPIQTQSLNKSLHGCLCPRLGRQSFPCRYSSSTALSESDEVEKTNIKMKFSEELYKMATKKFGESFAKFVEKLYETENLTMTDSDWELVLSNAEKEGRETGNACEAFLMSIIDGNNQPEVGISLMKYIRKKKIPALSTSSSLIAVCGEKYPDVVFQEYDELTKHYSLIDQYSYVDLIKGFSKTSEWKKCFEFVEQMNVSGVSECSTFTLSFIVNAAVANNDMNALDLLLAFANKNLQRILLPEQFSQSIFNAWQNGSIRTEKFLNILSEKKGYLTESQATYFSNALKRESGLESSWGKIINGKCSECGGALKGEFLQASQIKLLEQRLHSYITSGKHVYIYSYPKEYEEFCGWLKQVKPFDIVVDAANMLAGSKYYDGQYVVELLKTYKRILFVCNQNTSEKYLKKTIRRKFHMYTPHHSSDDDFFMLVAALHSGPGCYIVSGDNFRNLKACIGRDVVPLFEQWQRYRQYFLTQRFNSPYMIPPQEYDFCVQKHDNGWHVPYGPDVKNRAKERKNKDIPAYTMPDTLLCLKTIS